jgi:hypothetical protein
MSDDDIPGAILSLSLLDEIGDIIQTNLQLPLSSTILFEYPN